MGARPVIALVCRRRSGRSRLADYLERRGYEVREARQPWEAESLLSAHGYRCRRHRRQPLPAAGLDLLRRHAGEAGPSFVMICRPADLIEKVLALELGAADIVPARSTARTRRPHRRPAGRRGKGSRNWSCWRTPPSISGRRWSCTGPATRSSFRRARSRCSGCSSPIRARCCRATTSWPRRRPKAPTHSTARSIRGSCACAASSTPKPSPRSRRRLSLRSAATIRRLKAGNPHCLLV